MIDVSNVEFLTAIFGEGWGRAHVTAFSDDPGAISVERRGICWAGGWAASREPMMHEGDNQYFCISLFSDRYRRKSLFTQCNVIVADDVREKLPLDRVEMLPEPTYKLLTSAGSEQWGWVLSAPMTVRGEVEALLDGLVSKGLAPDGTDPGMRGVTRYVRLPEGSNTKASRGNFKCRLISWEPGRRVSGSDLAAVFDIDLSGGGEGCGSEGGGVVGEHPEHPIWGCVRATGTGAEGWVRIDCPNGEAHSGGDLSGAAVRVMLDGSLQFVCHHGHCAEMTGGKIASRLGIEGAVEVFRAQLRREGMAVLRDKLAGLEVGRGEGGAVEVEAVGGHEVKTFGGEKETVTAFGGEKVFDVRRYIFVAKENKFYDVETRTLIPVSALDSRYLSVVPREKGKGAAHLFFSGMGLDDEADGFCWEPVGLAGLDRDDVLFMRDGQRLVNTWSGVAVMPGAGVSAVEAEEKAGVWLEHAAYLFPDAEERGVVLDYLACLVQRLDKKPGFWLLHRGAHGVGKDLFYRGVIEALGEGLSQSLSVEDAVGGWGNYLNELKFCIIEEVAKEQNKKVTNAMKTLCSTRGKKYMNINIKGGSVIQQRDCIGGVIMSNMRECLAIDEGERRYFVVDSYMEIQSPGYYKRLGDWYDNGGVQAVMDFLWTRDLSEFNHNVLPWKTPGCLELMETGKSDFVQSLEDEHAAGCGVFGRRFIGSVALKRHAKVAGWWCGMNGLKRGMEGLGYVKIKPVAKIDGKTYTKGWHWVSKDDAQMSSRLLFELIGKEDKSSNITQF